MVDHDEKEMDKAMEEIFREKETLIKNIHKDNDVFKLLFDIETALDWAIHIEDIAEKNRLMEEILLKIQERR